MEQLSLIKLLSDERIQDNTITRIKELAKESREYKHPINMTTIDECLTAYIPTADNSYLISMNSGSNVYDVRYTEENLSGSIHYNEEARRKYNEVMLTKPIASFESLELDESADFYNTNHMSQQTYMLEMILTVINTAGSNINLAKSYLKNATVKLDNERDVYAVENTAVERYADTSETPLMFLTGMHNGIYLRILENKLDSEHKLDSIIIFVMNYHQQIPITNDILFTLALAIPNLNRYGRRISSYYYHNEETHSEELSAIQIAIQSEIVRLGVENVEQVTNTEYERLPEIQDALKNNTMTADILWSNQAQDWESSKEDE